MKLSTVDKLFYSSKVAFTFRDFVMPNPRMFVVLGFIVVTWVGIVWRFAS